MEHSTNGDIETREVAKKIAKDLILNHESGSIFVGLVGDLGAGKTTFMKGVAEFFGVSENVSSPTFVIQKIYEIEEGNREKEGHKFQRIIHMDLYRLENEKSLEAIKWEDYKNESTNILFIEWPNQIWQNFPEDMKLIKIEHLGGDKRKIIYG